MLFDTRRAPALLAIVLLVAACQPSPEAPRAQPAPPPPVLIGPKGATDWPITFAWQAVPGPNWNYRVVVVDRAERVLTDLEVRGVTSVRAPDDLKGMLGGSQPFSWWVGVIGRDGSEVVRSRPAEFSLR